VVFGDAELVMVESSVVGMLPADIWWRWVLTKMNK
jgi:hypothetical protein